MINIRRKTTRKPLFPKRNNPITLLEVMIGLSLLLIVSAAVGQKVYALVEKRRFSTKIHQIQSRCLNVYRMAVYGDVDWKGVFRKEGRFWIFECFSLDSSRRSHFSPIRFKAQKIVCNGEEVDSWELSFFSSAYVSPSVEILFFQQEGTTPILWKIPSFFGLTAGNGLTETAPQHPANDL